MTVTQKLPDIMHSRGVENTEYKIKGYKQMIQAAHPGKKKLLSRPPKRLAEVTALLRSLVRNWEILLLLFASLYFHLVNIDTAIFSTDEADVFRMARQAITTGWLPLTSNRASLGNLNPSLVVYFFLLPASISANPLWGQVMVALFNAAAVLLTYFFVRRYYGRLAGAVAALLFATSAGAWTFSRNIWPQNFLPFFVVLFFFTLFRGVVEKRKGWLFWAILLLGVLYQFHGSSLYLLFALGAAVVFALKTIRWRDLLLGAFALVLLFLPYLVWEYHVHFVDIFDVITTAQGKAQIDTQALHFYLFFLHPTLVNPYLDWNAKIRDTHLLIPDNQSVLAYSHLHFLLKGAFMLAVLLLIGGFMLAFAQVLALHRRSTATGARKHVLLRWWTDLQASPSRQGLVLLLLWQALPLLLLSRHSVVLFVHYFIFFLPGPFILIALCVTRVVSLVSHLRPTWERLTRFAMLAMAALVILGQLIGMGSTIIDLSEGHFKNAVFSDLHDQQQALRLADQLAQQRHIQRLYITFFPAYVSTNSMDYLTGQTKTPAEVFSPAQDCFILPSLAAGPVLFLTTSDNILAETLFRQYADVTLVATSPHLSMSPYQIYQVTAKAEPATTQSAYQQDLHLLSPTVQVLENVRANSRWLVSRWSVVNTSTPELHTAYDFQFQMGATTGSPFQDTLDCAPERLWAGDQLFILHHVEKGTALPTRLTVQASMAILRPQTLSLGPFTGFIFYSEKTNVQTLLTVDHKDRITLPVATSISLI